ncbi:MarR family transcriptional regulator [Ferrovibrio sp.]|uniref:MarR family winged helix-turn-helix transcriptional regulator n=1 Tax=Ferrovibrio sp. TaxID=1917215 RepID=UPI00262BE546|nr:MarR family transcriptional regulator [Ferrovibrio sp.]
MARSVAKDTDAGEPVGGTTPDRRFRIVNWIGIIDQLASTKANRVLRGHDLPLPQFVILNHFSHRLDEGKTVGGIARAMQQLPPAVTKTTQKLLAKGYLREVQSTDDARSKLLFLTARGRTAHGKAIAALLPELAPAFAGWTTAELEQFWQYLDRLKVWFDQNR